MIGLNIDGESSVGTVLGFFFSMVATMFLFAYAGTKIKNLVLFEDSDLQYTLFENILS